MARKTPLATRIFKKLWIICAIFIILAALTSSLFRSLTPWAVQYKGEVEQRLSQIVGHPVTIKTMETSWYWFEPVLRLNQVDIQDKDNSALHVKTLLVGINLFKSLWHWRIQPGVLYVDEIHLNIRQQKEGWHIDGISSSSLQDASLTDEKLKEILHWVSSQERLILKHVSAYFYLRNGNLIPVTGFNLSIKNRNGYYQLKGVAALSQTSHTSFQLLGDVYFDANNFNATKGHVFFSAKNMIPSQWLQLFPKYAEQITGGKGSAALWIDLNHGAVSLVQAELKFKRFAWSVLQSKNNPFIQKFFANIQWKPEADGWSLHADKIQLRVGGVTWPENTMMVQFNSTQPSSYKLFIKSLLLKSLFSENIPWPALEQITKLKPRGELTDTQIILSQQQINYVLTRFDHLGWNSQGKIPGVDGLSGVLSWQPEEGKLELDSHHTIVNLKGYPEQQLDVLNGSLDWKQLTNGLRLSIDNLVVSQPELTLSAQGAFDGLTSSSAEHIRFELGFSGKNLQKWLPYLPGAYMKPKLLHWLQEIKRIGSAAGTVKFNGFVRDFPFDNGLGEFSIKAHVNDADIAIAPKWLPIKNAETYVRLKNRNLEFDLVNGEINTVPLKQVHLRIDDIGRDKETLLIHGIIQASLQKMIDFVLKSPLQTKLATLKMIKIKGKGLLDLRLQIPLYPESNQVDVRGDLSLKNNTFTLQHQAGSFVVDDLTGALHFDERGVSSSAFDGSAFDYPVHIQMKSEQEPHPHTSVTIDGECTIESLKNRFNWPIFSFLKGRLNVSALLKLTENPDDSDNVTLRSDLQGLTISLPAPIGKLSAAKTPSELSLDFNLDKGFRVRANYNQIISSDLLFKDQGKGIAFQTGQILLGSAQAIHQGKSGLDIVGSLSGFDLPEWKKVLERVSNPDATGSFLKQLHVIHVTLGKFTALKQNFDQLSVEAKFLADNEWALILKQKHILADLTYNSAKHLLSGHFQKLVLPEYKFGHGAQATEKNHPLDIPNLNVRVDDLVLGTVQLGSVTLKSHSTKDRWALDYCRVDSPAYQISMQGGWVQHQNKDTTKIQAQMRINNLAQSLERWQITPAVDAGKGDIHFSGQWNNTLFDFSLAQLVGTMNLQLRKGIITHLSRETEEKLGLGKLLSILSLQTIPRRLTLDFSDLSHDGFSFDVFKGTFAINKGIMHTEDSYLDGPVAYASMKGDLDLVRRLYDLNLKISPHITASLPIVATIAGGPIAGIATWVASKLINQGMQTISAYSYKISGPWSEPVVQQLSIIRKR